MKPSVNDIVNYFRAPDQYFWQWAEGGEVLEWKDGKTICYRYEMLYIFRQSAHINLPSFSAVILLLAAALKSSYHDAHTHQLLNGMVTTLSRENNNIADEELYQDVKKVADALLLLSQLRPGLLRRQQFGRVLFELFGPVPGGDNNNIHEMLDELESGRLAPFVYTKAFAVSRQQFKSDLQYIIKAIAPYPDAKALEQKVDTGLRQLPAPAIIEQEESSPRDLLDQLAEDNKTLGIARLAKRIIAALKIPMHTEVSGNLTYGGITDITNRGNYDKLLLTELANDDVLLMARLVNNEALYFKREEPPEHPKKQRVLLIDTTIKMWGTNRAFAVSAALACAHNSKHGAIVSTCTLGGTAYQQQDMGTHQGIIQILQQLDHGLHCGVSLVSAAKELQQEKNSELFLVTEEAQLKNPGFNKYLEAIKPQLDFLITLNRTGALQFYTCTKGRLKLLSTAKFDLEELLFSQPAKKPRLKKAKDLPEYIELQLDALYYPATYIELNEKNVCYYKEIGAVAVTENRRILYFPSMDHAAVEVGNMESKGKTSFLYNPLHNTLTIYQNTEKINTATAYIISFAEKKITNMEVEEAETIDAVLYQGPTPYTVENGVRKKAWLDKPMAKCYITNGYSTLLRIAKIWINNKNVLVLDGHELLCGNHHLKIGTPVTELGLYKAEAIKGEEETLPENSEVKLQYWHWPDGSSIIIDSRGLMYLKSANAAIPELVIPLVLTKTTACLSLDGYSCGNAYFINPEKSKNMVAEIFYRKYIDRYISHIIAS